MCTVTMGVLSEGVYKPLVLHTFHHRALNETRRTRGGAGRWSFGIVAATAKGKNLLNYIRRQTNSLSVFHVKLCYGSLRVRTLVAEKVAKETRGL